VVSRNSLNLKVRWHGVALALAVGPLGVQAQTSPAPPAVDWRSANDAVGQFKRGHIDLLKWEKANLPAESVPDAGPTSLTLATAQDAVRLAWRAHPELVEVQNRLGRANLDLIAEGRWGEVDIGLQRRVEDMGELLEVAAEARKAWVAAVAAAQVVRYRQTSMDSAEAAHELGQRMVGVGNWGAMEGRNVQLALVSARMDLRRARVAAAQTQFELLQTMRLANVHASVALPEALADVPAQAMGAPVLEGRVNSLRAQVSTAAARFLNTSAGLAFDVYRTSHALALDSAQALALRQRNTEEIGLQYNGMLASVWDVLGDARNQAQAQIDAVEARRDFWLAETDLQWVLQGGTPASLVSLGAGGGGAAAAAGH
jgi:outer membrane protein TolC